MSSSVTTATASSASSASSPSALEYKVPRLLWENFESILLAQSRRYIGELARRLEVSERELQRRVLPSSDSLKIMMMDSQAETTQCRAYLQQDSITTFCRKPVAYQSEFCAFHRTKRMNVFADTQPSIVERLKTTATKEPMWIQGNTIINSKGEMMGKINRQTQMVKWFRTEE
jgi:hypothetical protein